MGPGRDRECANSPLVPFAYVCIGIQWRHRLLTSLGWRRRLLQFAIATAVRGAQGTAGAAFNLLEQRKKRGGFTSPRELNAEGLHLVEQVGHVPQVVLYKRLEN